MADSTEGGGLAATAPNPYHDFSGDEYNHELAQDPTKPQPQGEHPVQTLWDKVLHGVTGKSRTAEMVKGVARGVVNAGLEGVKTIAAGAAFVDRKTGLGEALEPGFNAQYDAEGNKAVVDAATDTATPTIEHFLGKRSDDPLAAFTESATQFMAGWAATGQLKAVQALSKGAKVAGGLARGAVVDATMFDPWEAQLAELAARAPVPIVKQLGKLLSVQGDDSQVVARLKRAAAGVVPAAIIEGIVAASRLVRGGKALAAGAGDATAVSKDAQTVQSVAGGVHVAEDSHVTVDPQTNAIAKAGGAPIPESPKFADPVEAHQQAESINAAVNAHASAGQVDPLVIEKSVADLGDFVSTRSPEALSALTDTSLDLSYRTSPDDAMKIADSLATKMAKGVRDAVESQGEVHVEQSMQMALNALGEVPRPMVHDVMTNLLGGMEGQSTRKIAADYVMKSYQDSINSLTDVVTARPHDVVAVGELRTATQNYFDLQDKFLAANSDAARALRLGQERPNIKGSDVRFAGEGDPVKPSNADGTAPIPGDASPMRKQLENASPQELAALGRIFKMSGGEPRNAEAILKGAKVILDDRPIRQALEVFTNYLLSGPKTAMTVMASGNILTVYEPIVRMTAGAATMNRPMIQEGADLLAGAFKYLGENVKVAWQAILDGRSVVDPAPQTIAIGGLTGKVVRTPGAVAGGAHEFTKVTNYRSWIYARSLREGRASGLSGDALASYADDNLRAAFGPGGVGIVPDALKYGQLTSLSTPMEEGFGKALQKFTNNALAAKFIAPFVKISTNIFKYTWQSAPGLNLLNSQWRATILAGGEEAAIIHARSAYATTLGAYAYMHAVQGNLTGRGPSDPQLRSMWLKDNQPYSFRVNSDSPWHGYQRFEPLSKTLGLMADYHTISSELGEKHISSEQALYAAITAVTSNLASSTYMRGITEFGAVWGSDNPEKVGQWLQNMTANMLVPAGVTAGNDDPMFREVKTLHDAILNRIPGYSESLDPRFNWAGEPILKTPGLWNRNLSLSTTKDGTPTPVESELLSMNESLAPFPEKQQGVDLHDRETYDNGTGKAPYVRFMELLNAPKDGATNLRDEVTALVKSPEWKDMSAGAEGFPGGARMMKVRQIKTEHEARALRDLREEYPKLDTQMQAFDRMKRAAVTGGEMSVQDIEKEFGVKRHP